MRAAGEGVAAAAGTGGEVAGGAAGGVWHWCHGGVCVCVCLMFSICSAGCAVLLLPLRAFRWFASDGRKEVVLLFEAMRESRMRAG